MSLNLTRHEGQWVDVIHNASGEVLKIRVSRIHAANGHPSSMIELSFFDSPRNFDIVRPRISDGQEAT
jgi:hypothetical protein